MKPQKKMSFGVALIFSAQNLIFPLGVQAATKTSEVMNAATGVVGKLPAVFNQSASSPNFSQTGGALKAAMDKCALLGADVVDNVDKWKKLLSKDSKKASAETPTEKCDADCSAFLPMPGEPSCNEYGGREIPGEAGKSASYRPAKPNAGEKWDDKKKTIAAYVSCLEGKEKCPDSNQKELEKQVKVFNCQMQALQAGIQQASQAMQTSIQQNQKAFSEMTLHQKEVGDQMQQVDEILGPDPELSKSGSSQFQGLLGLQKELNENLPKMVEMEASAKNDVEKLKNDTLTNEQNLEANRVNVASQCIKNNRNVGTAGGYSLTCFKPIMTTTKDGASVPQTDQNGNIRYAKQSCGPYDFIRSKIEQQAFKTSRGVLVTQDRREKAASNAAAFDALVDSINRSMGDYDQKGADNARLDVDVHNWADIESKVSANIDAVASQSGVDIRSMLRSVGSQCFKDADGWKNKQIRSSDSEYSRKKAELKASKTKIAAQLDSGVTSMNKTYSDVMAVMFDKHVTLNRATCTKDDPEKMQTCFAQIRLNIQNLLEGNGGLTTTAKTIKGGSKTSSFVVSCRGLNGCVTAFKNVRDQQKSFIRDMQKQKEAYVNQSNAATQTQLSTLTSELSTIQNDLLKQYDVMKETFAKMGVIAPDKPKFLDPESLQPMEGPDKSQGPFQSPKSMAAVLSGMMQPSGMMNFADTGMQDIQKDIAEKAKEKKTETTEKYRDAKALQKTYSDLPSECGIIGLDSEDSGAIGSMGDTCYDAALAANSCAKTLSAYSPEELAKQVTELQAEAKSLKGKKDATSKARLKQIEADIAALNSAEMKSKADLSGESLKTLDFFSNIFTQMSNGKVDQKSFSELETMGNAPFLSLNSVEGCEELSRKARSCREEGKSQFSGSGGSKDVNGDLGR